MQTSVSLHDVWSVILLVHSTGLKTATMYGQAATLSDQTAVEHLGGDEFVSKSLPGRFGNAAPIAYGGCTSGIATRAACATVPDGYFVYSVMGTFLGPASTDVPLHLTVERTRDTRTFATRRVLAKQHLSSMTGTTTSRTCLDMLVDFHVREPGLLTYSPAPSFDLQKEGPEASPTMDALTQQAVAAGLVADPANTLRTAAMFRGHEVHFEARTCASGMSGQNLVGILSGQPTTHDARHVTDRVSGDWSRTRTPLSPDDPGERAAAAVFMMDGGLPFIALTHNHLWFSDAGANSTLDFAVRWVVPDVDLSKWHLRERRTIAAGHGRSFNEGRLWDEQGNLVLLASQQCILRPKPAAKKNKL